MSTTAAEKARVGMGAIPRQSGVAFRVWAPHAEAVCVTGSFNDWSADAHPMTHEGGGYWYADIASAAVGDEYRYRIVNGDKQLLRIDPYARQVPARWATRWSPIRTSTGTATISTCLRSTTGDL
jgi:1,4-alpha-glucan branching enzyme